MLRPITDRSCNPTCVPNEPDNLNLEPLNPSRVLKRPSARRSVAILICFFVFPIFAVAQTLDIHNAVKSYVTLSNTTVTMTGRSELRITGTGNPIAGSIIHLNSPDAWLLLPSIVPSQVASTLLNRVRVNGANAVLDGNVRVVQYAQGAVVIPQSPDFSPLEVFDGRYFTGPSKKLDSYVAYDDARLGSMATNIASFKLKRGYMVTFAQEENGTGISRNYVAQDGDLEVGRLPAALENSIRYVRIFPWRWVGKKGVAGNIESDLNVDWLYNWNLNRNSPLDWEYVPIRQTRWWPGLDEDWDARGATHVLGYNEPDRPDQANMTVGDAIWSWPDLLWPGLRVGAPAVSDGGLSWLYDFMAQADAAGLRVDYVPVHYYRCYGNAGDPAGTANQFYNFLKGIYDVVQRPLWITEWNNGANWTSCADPTFAQQGAAVGAIIDMLDNTPFVERYAIYNWVEDVRRVKWDDGSLTAAGVTYRDQNSPLAYRQEMVDAGIGSSARYSFDGHAHDEWGNGQDAMLVGAPAFTGGKYGQAIVLNGTTDYLQVSPRLGDSTDWSFTGWILWNGGGSWQRIFDLGDDSTHYLFLSPRSAGGLLRFAIQDGNGEQQLSGPALPTNVWTHVAVTIAGNTGKLFVNGVPVATNASMTINPGDVGTKFNYLGRSRFSADPLFGGRLDDFRFVSSALTDAQVAAIYNSPPPQFRNSPLYKPDAPIGQPYSATLAGDATGNGALTFSKMDGPAWLEVAASGAFTGTPGPTNGGVNNFLVRVTDLNGSLHTATLLINVPTVTLAVNSSADDAEQSAAGVVTLNSTDLELVRDDATSSGNQIIGLRFNGLAVPQGAIVTNATIQFTADESQSEATTLNFTIEAADYAAAFTTAANNLGARPRVPLTVAWSPAAWTAGQSNATQLTPNLAGLVQEVVSRPGWASGNAIALFITGTGHRTADSADKAGGFPPRLTVSYTTPTPLLTMTATVNSSANDAEQSAAGAVTLNSTDLELVNDGASGDQIVGLRFENVALPAGVVIANADLQFAADEAQNEATALTLRAQAADNAAIFTTNANNLTVWPLTAASVAWMPNAWVNVGERGPLQRSPDLSALVREVIARPGWASGNALAILINGTGHRTADAADETGGQPATFTVNYWPELPLGSYARWAATRPSVSSPNIDLDGDGYDHFFEYAAGLDPSIPNSGVTALAFDNAWLHFTYARPVHVVGVSYQVEWTESLGSAWSSAGVTQQILSDDGVTRIIRTVIPKGGPTQRFVRLKVSQ
jgi:hypothetical protein